MISYKKANFKEWMPCCYVRRQDIDVSKIIFSTWYRSRKDIFSRVCRILEFLAPVPVWHRCLLSCRRPIREQLAHEEGISLIIFRGKQSTLSNQKPASYECETFDGFSIINLGGPGSGLGWLRRDVVALLWNTDFMTWNLQNKADIWSFQRLYFFVWSSLPVFMNL